MALAAPDAERPQPTRPGSNGQSTEAGPSTTPARRTGESTSALRRRQFPPLLVAGSSSGFDSRPLRRCSQGDASWAHTAQSVARGVCGQKAGQALPAKGCGQAAREPPPKQPVQSVAWCGREQGSRQTRGKESRLAPLAPPAARPFLPEVEATPGTTTTPTLSK